MRRALHHRRTRSLHRRTGSFGRKSDGLAPAASASLGPVRFSHSCCVMQQQCSLPLRGMVGSGGRFRRTWLRPDPVELALRPPCRLEPKDPMPSAAAGRFGRGTDGRGWPLRAFDPNEVSASFTASRRRPDHEAEGERSETDRVSSDETVSFAAFASPSSPPPKRRGVRRFAMGNWRERLFCCSIQLS